MDLTVLCGERASRLVNICFDLCATASTSAYILFEFRMAASPDGKSLVVAMANGGIKQLDLTEARDGSPAKISPASGRWWVYHSSIIGPAYVTCETGLCVRSDLGARGRSCEVVNRDARELTRLHE